MEKSLSPTLRKNGRGSSPFHARMRWASFLLRRGRRLVLLIIALVDMGWIEGSAWVDSRFSFVYIKRVKPGRYRINYANTKAQARKIDGRGPIVFRFYTYRDEVARSWVETIKFSYQSREIGGSFNLNDHDLDKIELLVRPYRLRITAVLLYWIVRAFHGFDFYLSRFLGGKKGVEAWRDRTPPLPWPGSYQKKN